MQDKLQEHCSCSWGGKNECTTQPGQWGSTKDTVARSASGNEEQWASELQAAAVTIESSAAIAVSRCPSLAGQGKSEFGVAESSTKRHG